MQSYQNFEQNHDTLKLYNCDRPCLPAIPLVPTHSGLSIMKLFSEDVSPKVMVQPQEQDYFQQCA